MRLFDNRRNRGSTGEGITRREVLIGASAGIGAWVLRGVLVRDNQPETAQPDVERLEAQRIIEQVALSIEHEEPQRLYAGSVYWPDNDGNGNNVQAVGGPIVVYGPNKQPGDPISPSNCRFVCASPNAKGKPVVQLLPHRPGMQVSGPGEGSGPEVILATLRIGKSLSGDRASYIIDTAHVAPYRDTGFSDGVMPVAGPPEAKLLG